MRRGRVYAAIAIATAACQLDTSGVGVPSNQLGTVADSSDADEDEGDDEVGDEVGSDGDDPMATTAGDGMQDSGGESTSDAGDTTGGSQGTDTGGGTTTGPIDECAGEPDFTMAYTADTAIVVAPMALDHLANNNPYVYSEVAEMGTATFQFEVPCPGNYYFHAFVYDESPGEFEPFSVTDNGADSFYVDVEGVGAVWRYGCQTGGILPPVWQWQPVLDNLACVVADDKVIAPLAAGTHTITFLNRESGTNGTDTPGSAAAIAVLVVTNNPDYSP